MTLSVSVKCPSCGTVQSGNCAKVGDYAPTHLKWKCIRNLISTQSSWSCLWMKRKMCPYLGMVYYVTCHYEGCRLSLKCWISALPFMWFSLQPDSCTNRNQMMCGGERRHLLPYIGVVTFTTIGEEERADRVNIPIRGCLSTTHISLTIPRSRRTYHAMRATWKGRKELVLGRTKEADHTNCLD